MEDKSSLIAHGCSPPVRARRLTASPLSVLGRPPLVVSWKRSAGFPLLGISRPLSIMWCLLWYSLALYTGLMHRWSRVPCPI